MALSDGRRPECPERVMTTCPEHNVTTPCRLCAGDHAAGAHLPGSHEATCARCAAPTIPQAQLDGPTRAAGDKTLEPEEIP